MTRIDCQHQVIRDQRHCQGVDDTKGVKAGGESSACVHSPSLLYIGYDNTGKVSRVLKCLMSLGRVSIIPGMILRKTRDDSLLSLNTCRRMVNIPAPSSAASCFVSFLLAGPFSNLMSSIEAEDTWEAGVMSRARYWSISTQFRLSAGMESCRYPFSPLMLTQLL